MHRIAVLDDYQSVAADFCDWSTLPEPAEVVEFHDHVDDEDALVARLEPFDVVVAMRERTAFPRSVLERLPNLKLLVTTGRRNKSIDVAAATHHGITVCGTGILPNGTAELTWGLILAVARHIPQEDASVRAGGWQETVGTDLHGARLGIVGLGGQGSQVARIGLAFGMDVVAWSQNLTDERAAERCVTVCGTGAHPTSTAELTWALVLAVARHVPEEDAGMRAGGWQRTVGTDLAGARLGVVGLGRLGTRVARIGQAFGMDVVAWSQNLTDERATEAGVRRVERDELFATADVVTVHLVLSERTRGLVGRDELARMKRSAILVNTSRGPIVDEAALLEALSEGHLAGVGLDVYDREPLPADAALRTAPRTVLTPHLGYVTRDTYRVFYGDAVEDVAAFLRGEPVRVLAPA